MKRLRTALNYYRSERSYSTRKVDLANVRPFVFSIETTSVCNLKCVMCPYPTMARKHELIDPRIFHKVVDEICDYNGLLWLHNLGEPLIHPNFDGLVRYAKSKGLRCGFSTNATLLDEERGRRVLGCGLDRIILCMDGVTKETYESLRVGASFESVTFNIRRFLELKREGGFAKPTTTVQLIAMRETEDQVETFRRRWEPLADSVLVKRFSTWGEQVEGLSSLAESEHRYVPDRSPTSHRHPCAYLWRNVVVTANGDVIPCCVDFDAKLVVGNVRESSLREIWNGAPFRALRERHSRHVFEGPCASCLEWVGGPASGSYPLSWSLVDKLARFVRDR